MSKKTRSEIPTKLSNPIPLLDGESDFDPNAYQDLPPAAMVGPSLEASCAVLLAHVDPHIREMIHELAHAAQRPIAAYVLGYIKRAYDQRALNSPTSEGAQIEYRYAPAVTAPLTPIPCEWCGTTFTPKNPGQKYCPGIEGQEPCSVSAGLKAIREARRARTTPRGVEAPTPRLAPAR